MLHSKVIQTVQISRPRVFLLLNSFAKQNQCRVTFYLKEKKYNWEFYYVTLNQRRVSHERSNISLSVLTTLEISKKYLLDNGNRRATLLLSLQKWLILNVFPDLKKGTHGTPYLKIQPSCTEVLSLILYISIRLKNKKETYSHTATKLLLRRAINLEKRGIYVCEFKHHVYGKRKRWCDTASIERFHSSDQHLWQIYGNKRKCLHKKRVQLPQDLFGTPTWPPFHPWRHVKTLYYFPRCMIVSLNCHPSLRPNPNGRQGERDPLRGGAKTRITFQTMWSLCENPLLITHPICRLSFSM